MKMHNGSQWVDCPQVYSYPPCPYPRPPVLGSRSMRGRIWPESFDVQNPWYLPPQNAGAPTPTPKAQAMMTAAGLRAPFRTQRAIQVAGETIARSVRDVPIAAAQRPQEMDSVAQAVAQKIDQQVTAISEGLRDADAVADRGSIPMDLEVPPRITEMVPAGFEGMGQAEGTPWYWYVGGAAALLLGYRLLKGSARRSRRRRRRARRVRVG